MTARRLTRCLALGLAAGCLPAAAWADAASLGIDGPSSGTMYATPGVVAGQAVTTSMSSVDVDMVLHRGLGSTLKASVTATFEMDTPAVPAPPPLLLVAFPVTGLFRGAVRIEDFKVVVNRQEPPTVFRRLVRSPMRLVDAPVSGTWPAALAPELDRNGQPVLTTLADGTEYIDSYLWTQPTAAGKETTVVVTYTVILEPQPLTYSKTWGVMHNPDVVPFDLMWAGDASHRAYFFDYLLRPGATWKGFVGHETVSLEADRELGIDFGAAHGVLVLGRRAVPFDDGPHPQAPRNSLAASVDPDHVARGEFGLVWTLNHEKPTEDLLVEIPANLVKPAPKVVLP